MSKKDPKKVYLDGVEVLNNFELINHLRDDSRVNKNDLLVALCLASRRNSVSARCYPGRTTIMRDTGLSESSAKRSIKNLEKLNVIIVTNDGGKYTDNGKHNGITSNSYFFVYDLEYQYSLIQDESHPIQRMEYEKDLIEDALLIFRRGSV